MDQTYMYHGGWDAHSYARNRLSPGEDDDDDDSNSDDGPLLSYRTEKYHQYPAYTDERDDSRPRRSALGMVAKFFLFSSAMILFCVLMYIPVYSRVNEQVPKGIVAGWSVHTNRDTKTYVQPNNVTTLHEPKNLCPKPVKGKDNRLFLLIVVCSATNHFDRRKAIRETWGKYENYLQSSKVFAKVTETYKNYNYSYDLLPEVTEPYLNLSSANATRSKRSISGFGQILPKLAEVLEDNLKSTKTEVDVEKRFDDDDSMLSEFDMNKEFDNNEVETTYDYDYESNVMKIPPKGYEENVDLSQVLNMLRKTKLGVTQAAEQEANEKVTSLSGVENVDNSENSGENVDSSQNGVKYEPTDKDGDKNDRNKRNNVQPDFKLVFLLGMPSDGNNTDLQNKIEDEVEKYGDIIQEGFLDTYNNLTLKSIMLLKWVTNNCDNLRYILKTDDDMYINVPRLVATLHNKSREHDTRELVTREHDARNHVKRTHPLEEHMLIGDLICGARPVLDVSNKWFSPRYMYSGKIYPRYLSGTGYALSTATARVLYTAALSTPYLHLEDVFITGICALRARPRIKPLSAPGFSLRVTASAEPCAPHAQVTVHRVTPRQMYAAAAHARDERHVDRCERAHLTQVRRDRLKPKPSPKNITKTLK